MTESPIPIVIGVTGHRDLRAEELGDIRNFVREQLIQLQKHCPNSSFWMLSSLASGGDTLCAEVALELGIRLFCPLPMEAEEYAADFQGEEQEHFWELLSRGDTFVCPPPETGFSDRDACYRQAGIYVASHCHILLALWDGDDSKKHGCGTAAAVYAAQVGCPYEVFPCGSTTGIIQIQVNRISRAGRQPICAKWLREPDSQILSRTDRFNADAPAVGEKPGYPLLPEAALEHPSLKRLERIYRTADTLSVAFQKRHTGSLLVAAICCVALVLAYLMYDELDCRTYLLLYGLVLAVYGWVCRVAEKKEILQHYLQYRLLAETARVQCCVSGLGYLKMVATDFTWTQKQEAAWVSYAINAALIGTAVSKCLPEEQAREIWIQDQLQYHVRAQKKVEANRTLNGRICFGTLLGMLGTFASTFILEYGFPAFTVGNAFRGLSPQSWMKILWGTISAVTLFAADYFGKLSLERKQIDHRKMATLFQEADQAFDAYPQSRKTLFQRLAAEELIENGNWYSYSEENTLSFDI